MGIKYRVGRYNNIILVEQVPVFFEVSFTNFKHRARVTLVEILTFLIIIISVLVFVNTER